MTTLQERFAAMDYKFNDEHVGMTVRNSIGWETIVAEILYGGKFRDMEGNEFWRCGWEPVPDSDQTVLRRDYDELCGLCRELAEAVEWNREVIIFVGESKGPHDDYERIFQQSVISMSEALTKYHQWEKNHDLP